jgi:NADH:ubiquinone oxidoreductase subunit E
VLHKLQEILGVDVNETTENGLFTLELCACLGVCGNAPVMMINEELFGDLNEERVEKIIKNYPGGQV